MKDLRTTIVGAVLAGLLAVQPLLKDGYHWNKETVIQLSLAFAVAALGVLAKDPKKENDEQA